MTEVSGQPREAKYASELPSKHLPPVEYRDLPEPKRLGQIIGASVIILATAIGGGEFILWPYITSQVGLVFIWGAVIGFLTQFFINMEVERYTLATGETALTGFARLWQPWWVTFALGGILQNFWPGWATGATTLLSFVFGFENIVLVTILGLVAIGIALTASPVVYQTVEKIQFVAVGLILVFLILAVVLGISAGAWGALFTEGVGSATVPVGQQGLAFATLLGALAFAGAGGANNLVQSNYIRDKGMGMGQHIPNIVSPITGEEEAAPSLGYVFPQTEENNRRWRGWWRVANLEQFITFFCLGLGTLLVLSLLSYSTVFGQVEAQDYEFLQAEGTILQERVAPWFGLFFWLSGAVALFATNLGILDYTSRLVADAAKTNWGWLRENESVSESRIYFVIVWAMIAIGSTILLLGLSQPLVLVIIAAVIAGVMMFFYSILLIVLNRSVLTGVARMRGVYLIAMIWAVLLFGTASVVTLLDQF